MGLDLGAILVREGSQAGQASMNTIPFQPFVWEIVLITNNNPFVMIITTNDRQFVLMTNDRPFVMIGNRTNSECAPGWDWTWGRPWCGRGPTQGRPALAQLSLWCPSLRNAGAEVSAGVLSEA